MFVAAIEAVDKFTRPIHTITRAYGGLISPGSATLFFVNENGVAITCKHVAQFILDSDAVNNKYKSFKKERDLIPKDNKFKGKLIGLESKNGFKKDSIIQIKNNFVNCFPGITHFTCHLHPTLDLAIIEFKGQNQNLYSSYATFVNDPNKVKQGKSLCRLGYPFPEFNNFQHNPLTDNIEWTTTGNQNSPRFPIDGIITRFGGDQSQVATIELSTPGLRGQSGGPLFDTQGLVYGMQSMTHHLHLGFDVKNLEVITEGRKVAVSNYPFLHVGHCIHVDRIKEFLKEFGIKYYEEINQT